MASWRLFRSRYAELFREVDQQHPAFWTELRELLEEQRRRQYTTKGAQVRELPTTREERAQAKDLWSVDRVLYEVFGRDWATTADRATQTPTPVALPTTGLQTCSPPTANTTSADV